MKFPRFGGRSIGRPSLSLVVCLTFAPACLLAPGCLVAQDSPPAAAEDSASRSPNLVVVSWDGAADWVIDRLLAEDQLPNLGAMAARGVRAQHSLSSIPSKTAVAHAALWTGCWGDCNGITGNSTPLLPTRKHTPLERRRGFDSRALTAEPLYLTAAKAGRSVAVLSATQNYPAEPHIDALRAAGVTSEVALARLRAFSGFEHRLARGRMVTRSDFQAVEPWPEVASVEGRGLEAEVSIAGEAFHLFAYDDPEVETDGYDRMIIRKGPRPPRATVGETIVEARLVPKVAAPNGEDLSPWSSYFEVTDGTRIGATYFRLFALSADGSEIALYHRPVNAVLGSAPDGDLEAYRRAYRGFLDQPFRLYRQGGFGPTLVDGGDGTAEQRMLEVIAFDVELLVRSTRWAFETWKPEVVFHYAPHIDDAGHTWMGLMDRASPRFDAKLAAQLWPLYVKVHQHLDRWFGEILRLAGEESVVALVSDHGMQGVGPQVGVNVVLEQAGLLVRAEDGSVDLSRTRAMMPPWGDYFLIVHDERWRTGIVSSDQRQAVLDLARQALLGATDPETGHHLFRRVFTPEEFPNLGIGGPAGGDLYFDPAPGYAPDRRYAEGVVKPMDAWGSGEHGFTPQARAMHAIFFVSGPGVRRGVEIRPVEHIDVAPTLSYLIGIPAPPSARGRVLYEALDESVRQESP